jgi:hypothetical protein
MVLDGIDDQITAPQFLYLLAFDELLGGGADVPLAQRHANRQDGAALERARDEMREHLGSMCLEAGVEPPEGDHADRRHPYDRAMVRLAAEAFPS